MDDATTVRCLKRARELITPEAAWTRGAPARNRDGMCVPPTAEYAVSWCMSGAWVKAVSETLPDHLTVYSRPFTPLIVIIGLEHTGGLGTAQLNDYGTHADVLDAFDKAIERWEGKIK